MGSAPGVLLVNLGTPASPETGAVRRYLREFLSDPRVLDVNPVGRALLVNGIIAPFRAPRSAAAYRQVWTEAGSPLLAHGRALEAALAKRLPDVAVRLAMRYGEPSIAAGLDALRACGVDRVLVAPLYPQYAASSTGTAVEAVYRAAATRWNTPYLSVLAPFHDDAGFVEAWRARARPVLDEFDADHVLFSFHGLPERHCRKSDESGSHCFATPDCCERLVVANRHCYRAQCVATFRALQGALELDDASSSIAFQSRLGRDPWIRPFTDERIPELARAGAKRVAVVCPSFVADCLETLEEIGLRAAEQFREGGGEDLRLVPSLNAEPAWVDALEALVRRGLGSPAHS